MISEPLGSLLAAPFDGRVVAQDDDPLNKYSDFDGNPTVVYPWSNQGLRHAIQIKEHLGEKGFLRSGLSSSGDGRLQGEGGLVVDFSCFTRIEVRKLEGEADGRVTIGVEAGVNTQQLADELIRINAFLPLGDNPVQSVVSSVLSGKPGYFDRSMGRLREYVTNLEVITPQGDVGSFKKGDSEFDSILRGAFGGAIKTITFFAMTAFSKSVELMSASFVYSKADFEAAIRLMSNQSISSTMDLSVDAYTGAYGVILVSVKIAGKPGDHHRMVEVLDKLKLSGEGPRIHRVNVLGPAEIVDLVVKGGLSGSLYVDRSLVGKHYERVVQLKDFDSFMASFVQKIATAFAGTPGGTAPQVAGSLRLSLNDKQNVVVSAQVFLPRHQADAEVQFDRTAESLLGKHLMSRPRVAAQNLNRQKNVPSVNLSALKPVPAAVGTSRIPGFGGQIYAPGDPDYDQKRTQYASSSYPEEQGPKGSMHPCMVAYPRPDSEDIGAAIRYANGNPKNIQARSGGHQYCGLSSGGEDTILLSMDLYSKIEITEVNGKKYATVGPGARLTKIAAKFNDAGVTIPHGECPLVAIGGHVQTGGYGHFLRSYGLALDHVYKFKIYQSDGKLLTVNRPPARDENSLFWGVLGGGPGSFGILTEITFECIRDDDHKYSWGYSRAFWYGKSLFQKGMEEIQRWTKLVASGSAEIPPDVDMCMTVTSGVWEGWTPRPPYYLLEIVNGNKDGKDDGGSNNRFLKTAIKNITSETWRQFPCHGFEGDEDLSYMANSFVRREGTTEDGREFPYPYKKRLNCTKQPLTTKFVESFVDLVDRVVNSSNVLLVFQMFIGGGAYASPTPNPPVNAICHRDVVLGIVFDCFYMQDGEGQAEAFQKEMQDLLVEFGASGAQEIRMLWGTFGNSDETRISDDKVRKYFYDDVTWKALQQLKKKVDPQDLFHTRFTVQLP